MKNTTRHILSAILLSGILAGFAAVVVVAGVSDPMKQTKHYSNTYEKGAVNAGEEEDVGKKEGHEFANEVAPKKEILPAEGSSEASNTIFTNPGEDCSTSMNISWITPPGKVCKIEVVDESDPHTYIYDYEAEDVNYPNDEQKPVEIASGDVAAGTILPDDTLCGTFNDRPSKLANGREVMEKHLFEKHGYRLFNLKPDTDYSYRILTYDKASGKMEHSETHHFHTAGATRWKAAILGDFHHYSPEPLRLASAMGMLNVLDSVGGGIDWVLSTGDQCAWGGSLNFWTELADQAGFRNYMWASVEGNHDNMDRHNATSDAFFRDTHFFPRNGYPGQQGASYWFKYGDVLFLMLNNEGMLGSGSEKPAVDWMEKVIANHPSKYVVVVEHHQWLAGTDGSNGQLDRWEKEFDRLGVDLAISGNNHAYLRTYPLNDRHQVASDKGTYYVVTPSSDNERGRSLNAIKANQELIASRWSEGAHTVGGMIMDVNPKRIAMTLYDRHGNVEDSFTVPAKR